LLRRIGHTPLIGAWPTSRRGPLILGRRLPVPYDEVITILQYLVDRARSEPAIYRYLHRLYLAVRDWEPPPEYKRPTP